MISDTKLLSTMWRNPGFSAWPESMNSSLGRSKNSLMNQPQHPLPTSRVAARSSKSPR
jgi:hypothetical protein